jgi:DNA-3-methyladenine glycosylase
MTVDRTRLALPATRLAPRMLGAVILSRIGGAEVAVRLTEVEAYEGLDDPASHAFRGRTLRNAVMFGPPGHLYVYFTYGMHWCANVVCGSIGQASAILLRAGAVIRGVPLAVERRPAAREPADLARGPARLAACLGLTREHNGIDLCADDSLVQLASMPGRASQFAVSGRRVGVVAAAERPWRYWLATDPTVSTYRAGGRRRVAMSSQGDTDD